MANVGEIQSPVAFRANPQCSYTRVIACQVAKRGYPDVMVVKVQLGPVACGQVGPPGDERFDVYGLTVNHAAMMRGRSFTLGASLVDRLRAESRQGLTRSHDDEFVAAD